MVSPRCTAGREESIECTLHVRELRELHQVAGAVEADQAADPREGRDVGDGEVLAGDPGVARKLLVEHGQQAMRFGDVAVTGTLVLEVLAGELVEETNLAEHRADPAHLEHQP